MRQLAILIVVASSLATAQPRLQFDVASVKPNQTGDNIAHSNIPLGSGSVFPSVGGFFSATNITLSTYIGFAFKIVGNQDQVLRTQLPDWVMNERFDIQARAAGNPTKDDMRQMMQALLADRRSEPRDPATIPRQNRKDL